MAHRTIRRLAVIGALSLSMATLDATEASAESFLATTLSPVYESAQLSPGEGVGIEASVTNNGSTPSSPSTLQIDLPASTASHVVPAGCSLAGQVATCAVPALNTGESAAFALRTHLISTGDLTVQAVVTEDGNQTGQADLSLDPPFRDCTVLGTPVRDVLDISSNNDYPVVCTLGGNDKITLHGTGLAAGGDGDDNLIGVDGNCNTMVLVGEAGNDTLRSPVVPDGCATQLIPGVGDDTIVGSSSHDFANLTYSLTAVNVDLGAKTITGQGIDTIRQVESVGGSPFNDVIVGSNENETLEGYGGDDSIDGRGGDDNLQGQSGNDTLNGGAGNDRFFATGDNDVANGGAGDDYFTWVYDHATADGGGGVGVDTLDYTGFDFGVGSGVNVNLRTNTVTSTTPTNTAATVRGFEIVIGTDFNDVLEGNAPGNRLIGNAGDDTFNGFGGADFVYGGPGNDTLNGNGGDDQLFGEDDNDSLFGGPGIDLLDGGSGTNQYDGGAGTPDTCIGDGTKVRCES